MGVASLIGTPVPVRPTSDIRPTAHSWFCPPHWHHWYYRQTLRIYMFFYLFILVLTKYSWMNAICSVPSIIVTAIAPGYDNLKIHRCNWRQQVVIIDAAVRGPATPELLSGVCAFPHVAFAAVNALPEQISLVINQRERRIFFGCISACEPLVNQTLCFRL